MECLNPKWKLSNRDYTLDLQKNNVIKTNYQKFKFEALKPFDAVTRVEFTNNSYLI